MNSFSSGHVIDFHTTPKSSSQIAIKPYDATLNFNKVVEKRNDASANIYSIDINRFIRVLENEDLPAIHKITLVGRPVGNEVGLWDMTFNSTPFRASTACVMVAQADYTPIPKSRIISALNYVDMTRYTSRTHLNQLVKGDQIGIAINDRSRGFVYVLTYRVDDMCSIRTTGDRDNPSLVVPAVNVTLEFAVKIDTVNPENTRAVDLEDKEYPQTPEAHPFVSWLVENVYDIPYAYAWKPHFLPVVFNNIPREAAEAKLREAVIFAKEVDYATFEDMARAAWNDAKKRRPPMEQVAPGKRRKKVKVDLPTLEVVSTGDEFYASVAGADLVKFTKESMGKQAITERHLTNHDLIGRLVEELSEVVILSDSVLGVPSYLRFFSINF